MRRLNYIRTSLLLADIAVSTFNPSSDLRRMMLGILQPDFATIEVSSGIWTVAVVGVGAGATLGFGMVIAYPHVEAVRGIVIVLRSTHELFWALLLIQVFGLGPATGVLAIALPYAGIFAKVYAEMIEEADLTAERTLPLGTSTVSAFAFARLPELAERFKTYTLYRLECGMRSTLVLGFIGLPTIGFHLEGYFKQGRYAQAAAIFGMLGVASLGFHIDGAISELKFDLAVVLIAATVVLSAGIDDASRLLRKSLKIASLPTRLAEAPGAHARSAAGTSR